MAKFHRDRYTFKEVIDKFVKYKENSHENQALIHLSIARLYVIGDALPLVALREQHFSVEEMRDVTSQTTVTKQKAKTQN